MARSARAASRALVVLLVALTASIINGAIMIGATDDLPQGEVGPKDELGSTGSEIGVGPRSFELVITALPVSEVFDIEGRTYSTVDLVDDAVVCGPYGNEEHFMVQSFDLTGEVLEVRARLSGDVHLRAYPAPFVVSGPVSMGRTMVHPGWSGLPRSAINGRVETVLISSDDARAVRTYTVRFFPVSYFPDGTAVVRTTAVINVTWTPLVKAEPFLPADRKPVGSVDYLMITHESLADEVQVLADWKSRKGVSSRVVTVQDINEVYTGGDEQSKVRRFVMEMEQAHDLDYLLLVGDYNLVRTRNTRNIHPETLYGEPSTFATDAYFACVDNGTTWDTNGNKAYAEGGEIDDPLPDMAVGRLAINDPLVLSSIIDGLISREMSPPFSTRAREAVFMAGDPQNVPGDPTVPMDFFWEEYCDDVFDDRETINYDGSGTMAFSSSSFRSVVGTGHQAICYFSHGTQTGLPNLFSNSQVGTLSDTGPDGGMFAMACLTGWFDDPNQGSMGAFTDCFAEALTETPDRGLVGYIGSSRLAFGAIDTDYSGDAPGLEEDYWRGVRKAISGEINSTIGDVHRSAVTHFSESFHPFPSNYYDYPAQRTFLEYNLLGEPEAPLFFRAPDELHMEHTISPLDDWVLVRVTNRTGVPVEGAIVTLYRSGELGVKGLTDGSGTVNISIPHSNGGIVNLTAWKLGDRPALDSIELPDLLEPIALYSISPEAPDGLEGYYIRTPELMLYADEEAEIEYRWDESEAVPVPSGTVIFGLEGDHTLTFMARDRSGLTSGPVQVNISVDLISPELRVVTDPVSPDGLQGWFISTPLVNLTSTEPIFEAAWSKGTGPFVPLTGPVTLPNGEHHLNFTARDRHGNWNSTSLSVLVDLEHPYSSMNVSYPPDGKNGYYVTQPTIRLEPFDDRDANLTYRWDGGPWEEYIVPIRPVNGVHLLEYRANDISGNEELPTNSATFRYDPDLPSVDLEVSPERPDGTNGFYITSPMVRIQASDPTSGQDVEVFAALAPPGEGVDWGRYGFPSNGTLWIADGEWFLYIFARDPAGNVRTLAPLPFKVDTDRPSMLVGLYPPEPDGENGWYVTQPLIWLNSSSSDSIVRITVDDVPVPDPLVDVHGLPEGRHHVTVYPVDEAGNPGDNWTFEYSCDLTDPLAAIVMNDYTFMAGDSVEISANSSSDLNGIAAYRFFSTDGRSTLWMDSAEWNWTFLEEGFYSLWVQVKDPSGRTATSARKEINVTVPPSPPIDDNETDDDVPIGPIGDDDEEDDGLDLGLVLKLGVSALLVLAIAALIFSLIRRRSIQEVEWEDEESDEELDELDSIEEAEVLEELSDEDWEME